MILTTIFFAVAILCLVTAYRMKLDRSRPYFINKRSTKIRLYGLSVFLLILAACRTYIHIYGCIEGAHFLGC